MAEGKITIPPPIGLLGRTASSSVGAVRGLLDRGDERVVRQLGERVVDRVVDGERRHGGRRHAPAAARLRRRLLRLKAFFLCSRRAPVASLAPLAGVISEVPTSVSDACQSRSARRWSRADHLS